MQTDNPDIPVPLTRPGRDNADGIALLMGDPKKAIIRLSGPMIVAMFLMSTYNIVNAIWVAGLGSDALAAIRLAAFESEIAFQQYRRQLMLTLYQAEAAYWNLYFAQEQLLFFQESLAVAESILSDSRERLKAGQASELDVLEAESALLNARNALCSALIDWRMSELQLRCDMGVLKMTDAGVWSEGDGTSHG